MYPSQCESFRTNPKNVLYLVSWKMVKNRSDLIRFNPRRQSKWIRTNPKSSIQSDQSELGFIQTEFSIRFNPNHSDLEFIRIASDWKLGFGLVLIHSDWWTGLNRIRSDRFFTIFHQTRYKTFFGLVRNDSHWLGYRYRNVSDYLGINSYPILSPGLSIKISSRIFLKKSNPRAK